MVRNGERGAVIDCLQYEQRLCVELSESVQERLKKCDHVHSSPASSPNLLPGAVDERLDDRPRSDYHRRGGRVLVTACRAARLTIELAAG